MKVPEHCLRDVPRLESIDGTDYAFCNVGSSTGKYGFDWDGAGVHGVNLATQPQTLAQGFALLRHFAGRLAKGCAVVIPICPFSSVLPFYRTLDEQYKMYPFAKPSEIPFWTPARAQAVAAALPRVRAKWKGTDPDLRRPDRTPSPEAFRKSVQDLCACWRRQFEITDFNAPLNERNRKTFAETVPILCDGLRMCVANGLLLRRDRSPRARHGLLRASLPQARLRSGQARLLVLRRADAGSGEARLPRAGNVLLV